MGRTSPMPRILPLLLCVAAARAQDVPRIALNAIDNGDFREAVAGDEHDGRVPWWTAMNAPAGLLRVVEGPTVWLHTAKGEVAKQPFAAYAPFAEELVVRGRVRGAGLLVIVDGTGDQARFPVADGDFRVTGRELADALGHAPTPRFVLALTAAAAGDGASWTDVAAEVSLPCPSEAELRAEIVAHLDDIYATWFGRGMEPAATDTGFVHHVFDVVTGARLYSVPGGLFPLFSSLLDALAQHEDPRWRTRFEAFLEAYLARCVHPDTGLPCRWLLAEARVDADTWIEPHADLRFLLDVAERGPERFRARARAAAVRMSEAILAVGVLPDGNVAARYRARDRAVSLDALPLRRLDTPAQLARVGALTGDARFTDAARNALAEFEYTHHWPGTWEHIDPGFDDEFGTYAGRAVVMLAAHPGDAAFDALVRSGHEYYAPRWRDALRFGGTVAADQVRCWKLLLDYAALEPDVLEDLVQLLPAALRVHVKGEQYANGAWGDVTIAGFDPKTGIQVGDLPGTPSNLLQGLALCYDRRLALDRDEVRALYATVLRTTDERYRRPYGYLLYEREHAERNDAGGGLRLLAGLTEMLARLPR